MRKVILKATFMRIGETSLYKLTQLVNTSDIPARIGESDIGMRVGDTIEQPQLRDTINNLRQWTFPEWEITLVEYTPGSRLQDL